jgi:hypothetical protein
MSSDSFDDLISCGKRSRLPGGVSGLATLDFIADADSLDGKETDCRIYHCLIDPN